MFDNLSIETVLTWAGVMAGMEPPSKLVDPPVVPMGPFVGDWEAIALCMTTNGMPGLSPVLGVYGPMYVV